MPIGPAGEHIVVVLEEGKRTVIQSWFLDFYFKYMRSSGTMKEPLQTSGKPLESELGNCVV